jgi:NADH-quinone oxidoreductase subunit D
LRCGRCDRRGLHRLRAAAGAMNDHGGARSRPSISMEYEGAEPATPGDGEIRNYSINFGPQHPAAHGVLRLVLELDGEIVERVDQHIGFLHRGTEKFIEYKPYLQTIPYFDRLDYCSPMCMEHSYVLAIEKLLDLAVPERGQYLRVLFAELTRIKNHLLNLGSHIMDVGAMSPNLWLFEIREEIMNFYERVSGARMHANYFRVGGVNLDAPPDLLSDLSDWLGTFPQKFEDSIALVADNRIFKSRNVDIGAVDKDNALAWGFSGPMLRASGVPWDLRKSQPYDAWTSTFPLAPRAIATTDSWSASRKSASRRGSCASASISYRRAPSSPTITRSRRHCARR